MNMNNSTNLPDKLRGYYFAPDYENPAVLAWHAIRLKKYTLMFLLKSVQADEEYTFEIRGRYYYAELIYNPEELSAEKITSEIKKIKAGFDSFLFLKHQFHKSKASSSEEK